MPNIYLDACCLNRPFDDQKQHRIHLEAEALLLILSHFETGEWKWVGSDVLTFEADQIPDTERRVRVKLLLQFVHTTIRLSANEVRRGQELQSLGFSAFDALHIASAESGEADLLLTTDDRFLARAKRNEEKLKIRVENPLQWLEEVEKK